MKKRVKVRISSSKVYLYETGSSYSHPVILPCGSISNPYYRIDCPSPGTYCVPKPCTQA